MGTSNGRVDALAPSKSSETVKATVLISVTEVTCSWFFPRLTAGLLNWAWRTPLESGALNYAEISTPSRSAFILLGSAPLTNDTERVTGRVVTTAPLLGDWIAICAAGGVGGGEGGVLVPLLDPHATRRVQLAKNEAPTQSRFIEFLRVQRTSRPCAGQEQQREELNGERSFA